MTELFGFAAGQQAAVQQNQAQEMTSLAMAEGSQKIRSMQLANTEASLTLQRQEMFNKLLQQRASKAGGNDLGSDGIAGQMREMAELALDSGLPEQAAEYATKASTIERNATTVASNKANVDAKHAALISNLLDGVHDQESWSRANASYMLLTGQPSPVANLPYDPRVVERMKQAAVTTAQRATIAKDAAQRKEAQARQSTQNQSLQERIRHDKAMELEQRNKSLAKTGATVHVPSANNLKAVTDLINQNYDLDPGDQAHARVLARPIAERAQELLKGNPDMTQSEAVSKAFREAQRHNDFAGMPDHRGMPGESAKTAMPLPDDRTKLKDNQWYTVRGQPALYKNGKFTVDVEVQQ